MVPPLALDSTLNSTFAGVCMWRAAPYSTVGLCAVQKADDGDNPVCHQHAYMYRRRCVRSTIERLHWPSIFTLTLLLLHKTSACACVCLYVHTHTHTHSRSSSPLQVLLTWTRLEMANVPVEATPTCQLRSVSKHRGTPAWTLLLQLLKPVLCTQLLTWVSPCQPVVGHHMMQLIHCTR